MNPLFENTEQLPLINMPMLRSNRSIRAWQTRQLNRVIQTVLRHKMRGFTALIDAGRRSELSTAVQKFRIEQVRANALKPALMNAVLHETQRTPAADGSGEWVTPARARDDAAILYTHGGAFVMDRSDQMTAFAARLAVMAGLKTKIVDYRLAPEHPCPAAVDDVEAALLNLYGSGVAPSKIVMVGDSAAGSINLAVLQRLKEKGLPLPAGLALFSPWVDLTLSAYSLLSAGLSGESPYTMEMAALCAKLYIQDRFMPTDPVPSPVLGDLTDLPPILIHVSEKDSFFDDSKLLTRRIQEAGGKVLLRVWPAGGHVWEYEFSEDADISIMETARFIQGRIEGATLF